ncbi:MAG: Signal recognition particle 54 kDa protein [Alphaproteobacteria bacterium MarineAlpha2_Bin1]|nr:MAG: Signal recognition particle 54 kDa protein [Alphaproteobacteria bacterium MarineAlpha2_Bin1]
MKITKFFADSIPEAISEARAILGDNAIIVSSFDSKRKRGAYVTAAIEQDNSVQYLNDLIEIEKSKSESPCYFTNCLRFHGLEENKINALNKSAEGFNEKEEVLNLAGSIDANFKFEKIKPKPGVPFFILGPPGSGKTTLTARIAAEFVFSGKKVTTITTDTIKAGACQQLNSLSKILNINLNIAQTPNELLGIINQCKDSIILIDTPAINYLSENEINEFMEFKADFYSETLLVLSALSNPLETSDISKTFLDIGTSKLHVTHTDCSKRLGVILSPPIGKNMSICEISNNPFITDSIKSLNPVSLARILLESSKSTTL